MKNITITNHDISSEPTGVIYTYQLIGMAVSSGSNDSLGHVTAFIKDQWEAIPKWYHCNDLGTVQEIKAFPTIWPDKNWSGMPQILIYKKIETKQDPIKVLDDFGHALRDIL